MHSKEGKAGSKKLPKVFVLDTNVILHDSHCIYKFADNDIIIPIQVIEELDSFKKGLDSINYSSREFIRILDDLSTDTIFNGGVSLGQGHGKIKIQLAFDVHGHIKKNLKNLNTDASIINTAYMLSTQKSDYKDREVVLVSKDANLRMKAKALNIKAEDYLSESVVNIDFLLASAKEIMVEGKIINQLYKKDQANVTLPEEYSTGLVNNQALILKNSSSEKSSALAIWREGVLKLIKKDKIKAFGIGAKNFEQAFAMEFLLDPEVSLITIEGSAGTGKTLIAMACALQQLGEPRYHGILYTRQTISLGDREIGFLPGDAEDKIGPFMSGMEDNLGVLNALSQNIGIIKGLREEKKLVIEPLPYIRGRSLSNIFFIIDESQNLTPHEIKTIVTRAGEGTKVVFIGDTHQIDHPYLDQKSNGLSYLIEKMRGQSCYAHMTLLKGERSKLAELAGSLL